MAQLEAIEVDLWRDYRRYGDGDWLWYSDRLSSFTKRQLLEEQEWVRQNMESPEFRLSRLQLLDDELERRENEHRQNQDEA